MLVNGDACHDAWNGGGDRFWSVTMHSMEPIWRCRCRSVCSYPYRVKTKESSDKMLPTLGIEPGPLITSALVSLYSDALLILTKSSKFKNQVVYEKNFKDLLSSTCLTSSERSVGLGTSIYERPRFYPPLGGAFCHWIFCFYVVKPLMPILALSYSVWKLDCQSHILWHRMRAAVYHPSGEVCVWPYHSDSWLTNHAQLLRVWVKMWG